MVGGLTTPSLRSATPSPKSLRSDAPSLIKAKSASHLASMATVATPPRGKAVFEKDSDYLNTLPDPRAPSPAPLRTPSADGSQDPHPDLSNEVAMLSTKLINAINYQTNLDDSLQNTRHELEEARRRIAQLESENREHAFMLSSGALVQKTQYDTVKQELAEASKQRDIAEKGRKEMEVELETLTSALFEEANTMVAAARKESEAVERKNAQLRTQLNDTELLLASQQEQLQDLKSVMERMTSERDETETMPRSSTAPSTPGVESANRMSRMFDSIPLSPNTPALGDVPPDHPLRFSHLITPVMRNDVNAYADFADLLKSSRAAAPSHSRNSSGVGQSSAYVPSAASSSPNIPGSFSSGASASPRDNGFASSLPPLKDNKFYKRCLAEDIEPTLRLDLAPGLSWLARRTVVGAISSGSLVVEPFIPQSRFYGNAYACALCGESRRSETHARRHRFRTSEDDSAQRYPLCEFCLGRVRATCDLIGFLRMVRDGLWRAATEEDVKGAWEESVRLREKMFWARLGGGVVPTATRSESPTGTHRRGDTTSTRKDSSESSIPTASKSEEIHPKSLDIPKLGNPLPPANRNGKSTPSINEDVATPMQGSEGSETRDFAAAHGDAASITPTSADEDMDSAVSRTTAIEEDENMPGEDSSGEPDTALEGKENQAPAGEMPGSFD